MPKPWPKSSYVINEDDPRAPSTQEWEQMNGDERAAVVEGLPSYFPPSEEFLPEGDLHLETTIYLLQLLRTHFQRIRRNVYFASNLPVYYPAEKMFSPDLMAVTDVQLHRRNSWIVSHEGRGLSWVLEVVVSGHRKKDRVNNLQKYARLEIPEYFIFDLNQQELMGFRLPEKAPKKNYDPILPQKGRYYSAVLDLNILAEDQCLRFFHDSTELFSQEIYLEQMVATLKQDKEAAEKLAQEEVQRAQKQAQEQAQRAQKQAQRAQKQAQRAQEAERKLAAALAEIERLKN